MSLDGRSGPRSRNASAPGCCVGAEDGQRLEMSWMEIVQRMVCAEARVDTGRIRTGKMGEAEWRRVSTAVGRLAEAPLYIDDTPSISMGYVARTLPFGRCGTGRSSPVLERLSVFHKPTPR